MRFLNILVTFFCSFGLVAQNVDSTQTNYKQKIQLAKNDSIRVSAMIDYGEYLINHRFIESEPIARKGLRIVKEKGLHKKLEALLLVELGIINRKKGNYSESLVNYIDALNIFEKLSDNKNCADVYHNIAMVYRSQKNIPKSFAYFKKSLLINQKLKDSVNIGFNLSMLGINYKKIKKFDSAEYCFKKSKEIFEALNNYSHANKINNYLVGLYLSTNRKELAKDVNNENIKRSKFFSRKTDLVHNYSVMSNIYYKEKEYRKAGKYIDSAIKLAKKEGLRGYLVSAYAKKSKLWYKLKNYKSAYLSHIKYKKYSDSLFNSETAEQLLKLEYEYNYKKEKFKDSLNYIARKEKAEILAKNETTKKQLYSILFFVTLIAAGVVVYLLRKNYKQQRELLTNENMLLQETNKEISSAFEELKKSVSVENKAKAKQELKALKILTNEDWNNFKNEFELLHPNFMDMLNNFPVEFTKSEIRFLMLKKLGLEALEIASIVGISKESVGKSQYRLRKKMNLAKGEDLIKHIDNQ